MEASLEDWQLEENETVESAPPSEPWRKLRILCLHGFRTSGRIMTQQVALANWRPLVDDLAELVFVDAPWPARGKSDTEKKFSGPYFEWFQSNADFSVVYGLDESLSHLSDFVSLNGPFDGFLGFSQGGILSAALMGLFEKGLGPEFVSRFKFVIVVGSSRHNGKVFRPAYDDTISCPSLHFIGEKDFMRPHGEYLAKAFRDPVIVRHPFGHFFPRLSASEGQIFRNFLRNQMESICPSNKGKLPVTITSLL